MKMKVYLLLCLVGLILAAPQRQYRRRQLFRPQRQTFRQQAFEDQNRPIIPYNYGYEIRDVESMNFQNKAEMKDEDGTVFGSYSVLLPDGFIYTTSYSVTKSSGYVAKVTKMPAVFGRRL